MSTGELNDNKNQEVIIRAVAEACDSKIYYIIAGRGVMEEKLKCLEEDLGIADQAQILGFRSDVAELLKAALDDVDGFACGITKLKSFPMKRIEMSKYNVTASKNFDKNKTMKIMSTIYKKLI